MKNQQEWNAYYQEGKRFLNIALRAEQKAKFSHTTIFNFLGMAIEKLFMAWLSKHCLMPYNHTFADLIESAEQITPLSSELKKQLLDMDSYQEICSVEHYSRKEISRENLKQFIATANQLEQFIRLRVEANPVKGG